MPSNSGGFSGCDAACISMLMGWPGIPTSVIDMLKHVETWCPAFGVLEPCAVQGRVAKKDEVRKWDPSCVRLKTVLL